MKFTFRHSSLLSLLVFAFTGLLAQTNAGVNIGEWRVHLPYVECHSMTETPEKVFAAAGLGFFSFDKTDGTVEKLSRINGFSDGEVKVIEYDPISSTLWIGFANSGINAVKNNRINFLDDLSRSTILGDKSIYHIMFYNKRTYVSTGLGIIVYDQDKLEVKENYLNLGQQGNTSVAIYGTAVQGDTLFAVAGHKIIYGLLKNNINLADFNNWEILDTSSQSKHIASFNGKLYAEVDSMLQVWNGSSWDILYDSTFGKVNSLKVHNNHLVISLDGLIEVIRPDNSSHKMQKNGTSQGLVDTKNMFWYVTQTSGLVGLRSDSSQFAIIPNGPNTESSYNMINFNGGFWVTAGSYSPQYVHNYNFKGYNIFKDNTWIQNPYFQTDLRAVHDMTTFAKHPTENRLFIGTHGKGLIEFVGDVPVNRFDFRNSTLSFFDNNAGDSLTYTTGTAFDKNGNLWVSNYESDSALQVYTSDKIWKAFKLPTRYLGDMVIDNNGYKWMITPRPTLSGSGICVFNDNGTPLETADDRSIVLTTQNFGLPTNLIRCLAVMPNNEIWIGTDAGLVVVRNPRNIFDVPLAISAERIIIEQGGIGGYLLGSEVIYSIAVDGAGRRWVGTNKGAWLVSKNGL